ncbi:MAG TPA: acetylxylan esterase [Verrucomicrobiae bacterium]|jgi:cephalosporin-C deacetylase-like acetyl esterase|nr:acetylxylan esterase [Verrucomicrobiae bacterium]
MRATIFVFAGILSALSAIGQPFAIATDHTNGIYEVGQTVHWIVRATDEKSTLPLHYSIKSGGLREVAQGVVYLTNGAPQIASTFSEPGTLLATLQWGDAPRQRSLAGAVAAPDKIQPSTNRPEDFDAFWDGKIRMLKAVPESAVLTPKPSPKPGVDYWEITMSNVAGRQIRGQLARPHEGTNFPALLVVQWAGVYALQTNWVTDRAAAGWLVLNIEAHDIPIHEPEAYYEALRSGALNNYPSIGNDDRDRSYFLPMYLSCYRAADYLTERPDWNGQTLAVTGDSQGGLQTLMIAGLHPKITAAMALVPAGCDMLGPQVGRRGGWPQWYDNANGKDADKVHNASRYFDVVNFASHIHCPALIGLGLLDETCPPAGVLAAVNQIQGPKKVLILPHSAHQDARGSQAQFRDERDHVWLPALHDGHTPPLH